MYEKRSCIVLFFPLATVQAGAQSRTVVNEAGELEWMDFDERLPPEAEAYPLLM